MLKVIALDFDGTLVESNNIKDEAFEEIFSDWPQYQHTIIRWCLANNSMDRRAKCRHFVEQILCLKGRDDLVNNLVARYGELTNQAVSQCDFVIGAKEFLEYFHGKFPVYLLSATLQEELDKIISARDLNKFFHSIYGAPINKTLVLKTLATLNSATANEVLFIGDSPEDLFAAEKAGVQFVGRASNRNLVSHRTPVFSDMRGVKKYVVEKFGLR